MKKLQYHHCYIIGMLMLQLMWIAACKHNTVEKATQWEEKTDKYPSGPISRRYWLLNGKKDSIMIMYNLDGTKSAELRFKNDLQEGPSTIYYPNGAIKEKQFFVNGQREGVFTSWHENGKMMAEITFMNNKMNGSFKRWAPNGELTVASEFRNDTVYYTPK